MEWESRGRGPGTSEGGWLARAGTERHWWVWSQEQWEEAEGQASTARTREGQSTDSGFGLGVV